MEEIPVIKALMTPEEVCAFLQIKMPTLDKMRRDGKLKAVPGLGVNRFKGADVLKLIRMKPEEVNVVFDVRNIIEENRRLRRMVEYLEALLDNVQQALRGFFLKGWKSDETEQN